LLTLLIFIIPLHSYGMTVRIYQLIIEILVCVTSQDIICICFSVVHITCLLPLLFQYRRVSYNLSLKFLFIMYVFE
jgi:hypothetical protein